MGTINVKEYWEIMPTYEDLRATNSRVRRERGLPEEDDYMCRQEHITERSMFWLTQYPIPDG